MSGAPAAPRIKTYSAQSGYVYQYFYQGLRPVRSGGGPGVEFVFAVSAGRNKWVAVSVFLPDPVVEAWQAAHAREMGSNERYAVAKLALFQAFDERLAPHQMREEIRVRAADIEAIAQNLDL
ncbi:MAG: hypothetical protein LAQ30_08815 [Acidobacteriia bacterium]|nr:hypothetical protein [Terriglobia bacterium]